MKQLWGRALLAAGLVAAAGALWVAPSRASRVAAPPGKTIYQGEPAAEKNMQLMGWGSGLAQETRTASYGGQEAAIKVLSHGFYAGGRIVFNQPIDLTPQFTDADTRYGFLEFVVQFTAGAPGSGGDAGGAGGTGGSGAPGDKSGRLEFGGSQAGDQIGGGGATGGTGGRGGIGGSGASVASGARFVKVKLIFTEGAVEAPSIPIVMRPSDTEGWSLVGVPFVAFKGIDRLKTFHLREVRVFTDAESEFIVGEIRTTTDDEPISIEPLDEEIIVAVNDSVEFNAIASAGIS